MGGVEEILRFHGFTRIEARVYMKLLELGRSKVSVMGKLAGITRTQLYPLLDNMVEKGYIRQVGTKPVKYEALGPEEIVKMLREKRERQIESLSELGSSLEKIKPVREVSGTPYQIYLIKERNNIMRKATELWSEVKEEVVMTTSFENPFFKRSRKLETIRREKHRKGVKTTAYLSIKPENLYRITEFEDAFKHASLGGLVKERPYTTLVFDRKSVLIIFYNRHMKNYETAFYFENLELAETFASKNIAPIESHPLKGEVRVSTIGGERSVLIPPVLDMISKKEQYKLGYGVGWYGMKPLKDGYSLKALMIMLETQMMVNGWGRAKVSCKGEKEAVLTLENSVVTPEFVKGNIVGFLSVLGNYSVKEKTVKKNHHEFRIKVKFK